MSLIRAYDGIKSMRLPETSGRELAEALCEQNPTWHDLEIDTHRLPAHILISVFFTAFLQRIFELQPDMLYYARNIRWLTEFDFQRDNIKRFSEDFVPRIA